MLPLKEKEYRNLAIRHALVSGYHCEIKRIEVPEIMSVFFGCWEITHIEVTSNPISFPQSLIVIEIITLTLITAGKNTKTHAPDKTLIGDNKKDE